MTPTRQEMIDRIYGVVKPTTFLEGDYSDIEYVMIGDVIQYIKNRGHNGITSYMETQASIAHLLYIGQHDNWTRIHLTKPIENQTEGCIRYIYSLVTQ